jgi:hypothetical protein
MLKGVLDYSEFKDVDMVIEVGCLKSHSDNEIWNFKPTKSWQLFSCKMGCGL